jgi:hypothetical protein
MARRVTQVLPLLILATVATVDRPAFAHHSVPGQFDMAKSMTLKGVVSRVEWINPHIYISLDVKETDGTTTTWSLETLPTGMMRKAGLTKESIIGQPGEIVTVQVLPARDGTKHLAFLQQITYADGRFYKVG